ncbi:DNA helicase [Paenibacillus baekrokdamisoli]|uniref:DNA 3'-5' helicase n=2 Tax=Paenibacillus baekrokdamisoli TaxID=1712516 RepID=A0A3G9JAL3_9BACL|nr:UvrD-helicase domain-containing protein [Paenibacillus baekrokdamisoli]BBH22911.1 DNA helicase [Paenibacillus baekrokdamisoli]
MNLNADKWFRTPMGVTDKDIPKADLASTTTSKQLVAPSEQDAPYFRQLEEQSILLNESQIKAVRHHNGPLLTLAGAGSGKTSVLICRTGYLISVRHISPGSILLLTFSSKAAAEMRERIVRLPGISEQIASSIQARTFHSFFLYMLRRQGISQEIFSETGRQHILLKRILRELNIRNDYQPETLLSLLSSYKMNLVAIEDLPESTDEEREIKAIFISYEQWKAENNKIDFDDVLVVAYKLLKENANLLKSLQNRFRYMMVDEFQDTNYLQYELVKMIAQPHQNLMVVGDDDQTIYSFNGARSDFILNFEKTYPLAAVITLDINYRSTTSIVGLGNEVIRHNTQRRSKTLQVTKQSPTVPRYMRPSHVDDEADKILKVIRQEIEEGKRQYGDYAVLYRSASNNRAILEQLVIHDMPHIDYGDGQLLYEHWLIKPIIDHLRLSLNRRNFEAIEGILPSLYINRDKGIAHIRMQDALRPKKGPLVHLHTYAEVKDFQKEKIKERLAFIRECKAMTPTEAIEQMRKQFYDNYVETSAKQPLTQHKEVLKETLDELITSAERFKTVEAFLLFIEELILKHKQGSGHKSQEQGNRIALMTIHRSKGLEFPVVFLIGASEGSLPHSSALDAGRMKDIYAKVTADQKSIAALEEERRLAYVAITRAREELIISSPSRFRGKQADISRFIMHAFGEETVERKVRSSASSSSSRGLSSLSSTSKSITSGRTETVPAWLCTGPRCNAWSRIMSAAEKKLASKKCPLCQLQMEQGTRIVPC